MFPMNTLDKLDAYLSSDASPPDSMSISDLDGFLTGILCSPELILPSVWLPIVWGSHDPEAEDADLFIWATQAVLERYNEIAKGLNAEPPYIEPIFWETSDGIVIAMDWCEGFMVAYDIQSDAWPELLHSEEGRRLMFPVFAHCFDKDGKSLGVFELILTYVNEKRFAYHLRLLARTKEGRKCH